MPHLSEAEVDEILDRSQVALAELPTLSWEHGEGPSDSMVIHTPSGSGGGDAPRSTAPAPEPAPREEGEAPATPSSARSEGGGEILMSMDD
jgi:hypothetical protein